MAQADAGTDPAAGIAAAVEAATVAVLAGIAVPGVGSPGTSVTQHAGMVTVHLDSRDTYILCHPPFDDLTYLAEIVFD